MGKSENSHIIILPVLQESVARVKLIIKFE